MARKHKVLKENYADLITSEPQTFQNIAHNLGLSVLSVQISYENAIRKIRHYLLTHKEARHALQEGLETLIEMQNKQNDDYKLKGDPIDRED